MSNKQTYEELLQEYEQFVYIVSHDLRAPLRGIQSIADWIEEDFPENADDDLREHFNLLKKRVQKLDSMMESLMLISRINRRNLDIITFEVSSLLTDLAEEFRSMYPNTSIQLKGDSIEVSTYKKKMRWVLDEVIHNAILHNDEKVNIDILFSKYQENVKFIIRDNGVGLHIENQEDIFNLFFTLEKKETRLGSGLFVAKKMIQRAGGILSINKEYKSGLEIQILWPLNQIDDH